MRRLIIVSHELPFLIKQVRKNKYVLTRKVGGFTPGRKSYDRDLETLRIGSPGVTRKQVGRHERDMLQEKFHKKNCLPIYLKQKLFRQFHEGFCFNTLWPLFHYFTQNTSYRDSEWQAYVEVNRQFAAEIGKLLRKGDQVWVHDYHLMLLPRMIREKHPDTSIGFFMHIPFPSYEILRLLPWRRDILLGMLGADLIGFHTFDYERHFMSCIRRLLGLDTVFNRVQTGKRVIKIDFFPLGIDYRAFSTTARKLKNENLTKKSALHTDLLGRSIVTENKKIILSIDRLDYTKGISNRLESYEHFLKNHPQYLEKVSLILCVLPSREEVPEYKRLKKDMDEMVGRINSRYGVLNWMPIWYFYRTLEDKELIELYSSAHIALITPLRDGMNLVAKEFLASRTDHAGMLILSEMAGAAKEMSEAIIVNPNNIKEVSEAILKALEMPVDEQISRNRIIQNRLKTYDENKWANDFLNALKGVKKLQEIKLARKMTAQIRKNIDANYKKASYRAVFLDYDGTLVGFDKDPQKVSPDKELYSVLKKLSEDENNRITIISGRDKETLGKWFGNEWNINFIAEHGVWTKDAGRDWSMLEKIDKKWMDIIRQTLQFYVDRTPRSFIEEKNYSLVWHYRDADPDLGVIRAWELKDELKTLVTNLNLEIMDGDKVIEIKNSGINKGRAARQKMGSKAYDFILAAGDDWTDEYTFDAMPEKAYTIKVGTKTTKARYFVESFHDFRDMLKGFAGL